MTALIASKKTRYIVSGAAATAANLSATWLLEMTSLHYLAVVSLAFGLSVIVSFILQKFYTFKDGDRAVMRSQFAAFAGIALFNLFMNDLLVYAQVRLLHIPYLVLAQAVASAAIAAYSFFLYKFIFKETLTRGANAA